MTRETLRPWLSVLTLGLFAGLVTAPATLAGRAGEEAGEEKVKRVHVRTVKVDCDKDSEDCDEAHGVRAIFIGKDGEAHEISGDDHHWVTIDKGGAFAFAGLGGGGGFLGVQLTELTPELRAHFGVPEDAGVLVSKVLQDTPAAEAGLQVGDIISAVNGESLGASHDLVKAIRSLEAGAAADLEVWRNGRVETLSATVKEHQVKRGRRARLIKVDCSDSENCEDDFRFLSACGDGGGKCEIRVECNDGDCTCEVNGEAAECDALDGLDVIHVE